MTGRCRVSAAPAHAARNFGARPGPWRAAGAIFELVEALATDRGAPAGVSRSQNGGLDGRRPRVAAAARARRYAGNRRGASAPSGRRRKAADKLAYCSRARHGHSLPGPGVKRLFQPGRGLFPVAVFTPGGEPSAAQTSPAAANGADWLAGMRSTRRALVRRRRRYYRRTGSAGFQLGDQFVRCAEAGPEPYVAAQSR